MAEAKNQLLWLETKTNKKLGRNRGIPKTQLGFSLNQKSVELEASLAPAEAKVGAEAKADQNSRNDVPLQRRRAAHTFRSDQN